MSKKDPVLSIDIPEILKKDANFSSVKKKSFNDFGDFIHQRDKIKRALENRDVNTLKVDYSNFANHVFFDSAVSKFDIAKKRILEKYPFSGSTTQKEEHAISGSGYENYLLKSWPHYVGYAFFNGTNQYITASDTNNYLMPSSGSLYVSVNINPVITDQNIIIQSVSGSVSPKLRYGYDFYISGALDPQVTFSIYSGSSVATVSGSYISHTGSFKTVAAFYDNDNNTLSLYFSNSLQDSTSVSFNPIEYKPTTFVVGSGSQFDSSVSNYDFYSGSIDEIRVLSSASFRWHEKNYNASINSEDFVKLNYKLNESITGYTNVDTIIVDYSKNKIHGGYVNYTSESRVSGSSIYKEKGEPILYSFHPDVVSFTSSLYNSASLYDQENNNYILRLIPEEILKQDEDELYTYLNLGIARFFDEIKLYIDQFDNIKVVDYSGYNETPDVFLPFLKKYFGIKMAESFSNTDPLSFFYGENVLGSGSLDTPIRDIRNQFWRRLLLNAPYLLKSKGKKEGVDAFLNVLGINKNFFPIKEYGQLGSKSINNDRLSRIRPVPMLSVGVGDTSLTASLTGSYTKVSNLITSNLGEFTVECTTQLPYVSASYSGSLLTEGSLWQFVDADQSDGSISLVWNVVDADSFTGKFILTGSDGQFFSSSNLAVFDGEFAYVAAGVNASSMPFIRVSTLETDTIDISSTATGATAFSGVFTGSDYDFVVGANSGSVYHQYGAQGLIGEVRYWSRALSGSEMDAHTYDFQSIGISDPRESPYPLVAHWRLDENKAADADGVISTIIDASQNGKNGVGYGFVANTNPYIKKELEYHYLSPSFDLSWNENKIRTFSKSRLSLDDIGNDDNYMSLEFNLIDALNRDITKLFSDFDVMNEAIGRPVNKYREEYEDLEAYRKVYFEKLTHNINFTTYFNLFKWFDNKISQAIKQLLPARARFVGGEQVVESHMLERPRYQYKYPVFRTPKEIPESTIESVLLQSEFDKQSKYGSHDSNAYVAPRKDVISISGDVQKYNYNTELADTKDSTVFNNNYKNSLVPIRPRKELETVEIDGKYLEYTTYTFMDEEVSEFNQHQSEPMYYSLSQSINFSNTYNQIDLSGSSDLSLWVASNVFISSSAVTDPLGNANGADIYVAHTTAGSIYTVTTGSIRNEVYRCSIFAKKAAAHWINMRLRLNTTFTNNYFDLLNTEIGTIGATRGGIYDIGNDWRYCWVDFTSISTLYDLDMYIYAVDGNNSFAITGSVSSDAVYLWGANIENSSSISSVEDLVVNPYAYFSPGAVFTRLQSGDNSIGKERVRANPNSAMNYRRQWHRRRLDDLDRRNIRATAPHSPDEDSLIEYAVNPKYGNLFKTTTVDGTLDNEHYFSDYKKTISLKFTSISGSERSIGDLSLDKQSFFADDYNAASRLPLAPLFSENNIDISQIFGRKWIQISGTLNNYGIDLAKFKSLSNAKVIDGYIYLSAPSDQIFVYDGKYGVVFKSTKSVDEIYNSGSNLSDINFDLFFSQSQIPAGAGECSCNKILKHSSGDYYITGIPNNSNNIFWIDKVEDIGETIMSGTLVLEYNSDYTAPLSSEPARIVSIKEDSSGNIYVLAGAPWDTGVVGSEIKYSILYKSSTGNSGSFSRVDTYHTGSLKASDGITEPTDMIIDKNDNIYIFGNGIDNETANYNIFGFIRKSTSGTTGSFNTIFLDEFKRGSHLTGSSIVAAVYDDVMDYKYFLLKEHSTLNLGDTISQPFDYFSLYKLDESDNMSLVSSYTGVSATSFYFSASPKDIIQGDMLYLSGNVYATFYDFYSNTRIIKFDTEKKEASAIFSISKGTFSTKDSYLPALFTAPSFLLNDKIVHITHGDDGIQLYQNIESNNVDIFYTEYGDSIIGISPVLLVEIENINQSETEPESISTIFKDLNSDYWYYTDNTNIGDFYKINDKNRFNKNIWTYTIPLGNFTQYEKVNYSTNIGTLQFSAFVSTNPENYRVNSINLYFRSFLSDGGVSYFRSLDNQYIQKNKEYSKYINQNNDAGTFYKNWRENTHSMGVFQMPYHLIGTTDSGKIGNTEDDIVQVNYIGSFVQIMWPNQGTTEVSTIGLGDASTAQKIGTLSTTFSPGHFASTKDPNSDKHFDHMTLYCYGLKRETGTSDFIEIKVERRPLNSLPFTSDAMIEYTTSGSFATAEVKTLVYKHEVDYSDLTIPEISFPIDIPLTNTKDIRISVRHANGQSANNSNFIVWGRFIRSYEET